MPLDTSRARALASSPDASLWQRALDRYEEAIRAVAAAKKRPRLVQLDQWLRNEYPSMVAERGCIGLEQLQQVMEWKLTRGKFRPLMGQIKKNTNDTVERVTQEAFAALDSDDFTQAITVLTQLKGVGVATASALVAPLRGSLPFMDDVAIELSNPVRDYTAPIYRRMRTYLMDLASSLGDQWDAEKAGKALWTAAVLDVSSGGAGGAAGGEEEEEEKKAEANSDAEDGGGKRKRTAAGALKKARKASSS